MNGLTFEEIATIVEQKAKEFDIGLEQAGDDPYKTTAALAGRLATYELGTRLIAVLMEKVGS